MAKMKNQRIIVTLRDDYVEALDTMVRRGVAPSQNALIQRMVAGFLTDVKEERARALLMYTDMARAKSVTSP